MYAIASHPQDDNLILSGGGDDKSYLWRSDNGETVFELSGHTDSVTAVGFSVDGTLVASAGMDGKVRVWKTQTGEFCTAVEGPDEIVVSIQGDSRRRSKWTLISPAFSSGSTGILRVTFCLLEHRILPYGCGPVSNYLTIWFSDRAIFIVDYQTI